MFLCVFFGGGKGFVEGVWCGGEGEGAGEKKNRQMAKSICEFCFVGGERSVRKAKKRVRRAGGWTKAKTWGARDTDDQKQGKKKGKKAGGDEKEKRIRQVLMPDTNEKKSSTRCGQREVPAALHVPAKLRGRGKRFQKKKISSNSFWGVN